MNIFDKQRMTILVIVLLIILNVFTLYIIFDMQKNRQADLPMGPPAQRTAQFVQEELGLTDQQMQIYQQIRQKHVQKSRALLTEMQSMKRELMDMVFEDKVDTTKVDDLIARIGDKQSQLERLTFDHFLELKAFCEDNQVDKLKQIIGDFFRQNQPPGLGNRPLPPGEGRRPPRPF